MKLALLALAVLGCDGAPSLVEDTSFATTFLGDRAYRRRALERAVVDPSNDYSALRLAQYALPTGWDALPIWNPPVRPVTLDGESAAAVVWNGVTPNTDADWLALGKRAFELWPVELDDLVEQYTTNATSRERFGLWTDDRDHVTGLVHVTTADAREHVAWTCSGCHSRPDANGHLVHGVPNAALDRGAMGEAPSWGPGVVDVTGDGVDNATAIPDLRATSRQSHLHWEATLANGTPALAVRIETLLIEAAHQRFRPPRELAVALALYVTSLGDTGNPGNVTLEGASLFEATCDRCHHADGSTEPPIAVEDVGTDPRAANSSARGHGVYRIPSLWGVADRGVLLHDGSVQDLETLLGPRDATAHPFGRSLTPEERSALIAFLETIGR